MIHKFVLVIILIEIHSIWLHNQSVVQIETVVNIFLKFKLNQISSEDNRQLLMALNL